MKALSLVLVAIGIALTSGPWPVAAQPTTPVCTRTYTTDADFDQGTLINVNHDPNHDQLQLNQEAKPFPFIWVACSGRGTIVRIDVSSGAILGEYRSAPEGRAGDPSRTTVDLAGNVWVGNRDEGGNIGGLLNGSVIKIGLVIGGTRVDATGTPDVNGQYLKPPFLYSTAVDRNGDGLIKTSRGLGDILSWIDLSDGLGGATALVEDADDECILIYQRLPDADQVRHVSVDKDNNVWVGGYPYVQRMFYKLAGDTGAILDQFDARPFRAGGYGGFIDSNGVLWSASISQSALLRYDLASDSGLPIPISNSYGLAVDKNGFIWNSMWTDGTITKLAPDGTQATGFPKPTSGTGCRGVAVTPADNNIWVANSGSHTVSRLDNDGTVITVIPVGVTPTGVAVDANGKVWVTDFDSNDARRIDPTAGPGGFGAVDLVVDLGPGAWPYNYSDMTGNLLLGVTQQGSWTVVHDSGAPGTEWGSVCWTSLEYTGTTLKVAVRAADNQAGLGSKTFQEVFNCVPFCDSEVSGQFLEVRVTFSREPGITETPVLYDLALNCCTPACPDAVTVSVYEQFTSSIDASGALIVAGGGAPYSGFVGSLVAPSVSFASRTGYNWHPFDLFEFGAEITGCLAVANEGSFDICLSSDDGSVLYIDGSPVIDNGGVHAPEFACATITLTAGVHPFKIEFFECCGGPSGVDLQLPAGITYYCPQKCPFSHGYWKNHEEAWPVSELALGSVLYPDSELLKILKTAAGSGKKADASVILAYQLIAAKLNIANGSDPEPVAATIAAADALIGANVIPGSSPVPPAGEVGKAMVKLADILDQYNNGLLTCSCHP